MIPSSSPHCVVVSGAGSVNNKHFDNQYSVYLKGYISESEWKDLINSINESIMQGTATYRGCFKLLGAIVCIGITGFFVGIIATIISATTREPQDGPPPIMGMIFAFFALAFIGMCCCMPVGIAYQKDFSNALEKSVEDVNARMRERGMVFRHKSLSIGHGKRRTHLTWIEVELEPRGQQGHPQQYQQQVPMYNPAYNQNPLPYDPNQPPMPYNSNPNPIPYNPNPNPNPNPIPYNPNPPTYQHQDYNPSYNNNTTNTNNPILPYGNAPPNYD